MPKLSIKGGEPLRRKPFPSWPIYGEAEHKALQEVLESGSWGIGGEKKKEFEEKFAAMQDAKYGIAVTSGTVALQLALKALGIGEGSEVIVPAYTFIATASAAIDVGATVVFVDVEPDTYNIDTSKIAEAVSDATRAIIPVHMAGRPADMSAVGEVAKKFNLKVVEDAAQAHLSEWAGRRVGAIGDLGCFSFQSSKNINCGEGGIILTDNKELEELCWSLHNCGRIKEGAWYEHRILGGNYRLTEWQAAILLAQMERAEAQHLIRTNNAAYLDNMLEQIPGLMPMRKDERITSQAYHLYIFRYNKQYFDGLPRDKFIQALNAEGIPVYGGYSRPLYKEEVFTTAAAAAAAQHSHPYKIRHLECPVAEYICQEEALWLYQSVLLGSQADMKDIVDAIIKVKENLSELFI